MYVHRIILVIKLKSKIKKKKSLLESGIKIDDTDKGGKYINLMVEKI